MAKHNAQCTIHNAQRRYIDAENFAKRINVSPAFKNMGFEGELLQRVVLDLLDNAPTADVEEVKHGEWIEEFAKSTTIGLTGEPIIVYRCSRCGRYESRKDPYCNCGAKMDLSEKPTGCERGDTESCKDCICYEILCRDTLQENELNLCNHFKNKADFAEVVRCGKCKHGDVSIISKTKDGQEDIACYCKLKNKVTDVDYYCPSGERK